MLSLGFGGRCRKICEDQNYIIYEYMAYNLNEEKYANKENLYDGEILLSKNNLPEPEIHQKLKRLPSGRKKQIIKRIPVDIPIMELLSEGKIVVKNASTCWNFTESGEGIISVRLIRKILQCYQKAGSLPDVASYHV